MIAGRANPLVLVTGGAGFIGSHLCEALLARGARVRVLDDFSTGRWENLARIRSDIEVIEGSLESAPAVERAVAGVDSIAHLAARSSVVESIGARELYWRVNVEGTATLFAAAAAARVRRVVFAASSSAYGDRPRIHDQTHDQTHDQAHDQAHDVPQDESMQPHPASPYAASKVEGERLVRALAQTGGVDALALRFFNVYGLRQDPNSAYAAVIPRFMTRVAEGKPVTVFSDGLQTRDFVHVSDTARAVIAALDATHALGGVIANVGTGQATTVTELVRLVGAVLGKPAMVEYQPAREGEVRHSVAATERAAQLIGFRANMSLESGLRTMV
jgi:nucleoside-diphosphate-sugar epimerase